jgi:nucleotide-binding universal stress UspA family protein
MIQHVACAVRGGTESQETVAGAIELALKAEAKLTFFHVIDPGCFDCGETATLSAAYREYLEKAESAMRTHSAKARDRGVAHVEFVLQEGDTRQELRRLAVETDAELLVLGQPRPDSDQSVFTPGEFHQFAAELDFGGELHTIQIGRQSREEG